MASRRSVGRSAAREGGGQVAAVPPKEFVAPLLQVECWLPVTDCPPSSWSSPSSRSSPLFLVAPLLLVVAHVIVAFPPALPLRAAQCWAPWRSIKSGIERCFKGRQISSSIQPEKKAEKQPMPMFCSRYEPFVTLELYAGTIRNDAATEDGLRSIYPICLPRRFLNVCVLLVADVSA